MSCKVLLTGISGWIGKHIAIQLLNAGHTVVGTVRNKNLIEPTKETLKSKKMHLDVLIISRIELPHQLVYLRKLLKYRSQNNHKKNKKYAP